MPINLELAAKRNLPLSKINAIDALHHELNCYLNRPLFYFSSYKEACQHVERIEFVLQGLWGFPINDRFHSYWHQFKECTCPNLDNSERMGTGDRVIRTDCPVHEWLTLETVRGVEIDE